MDITGFTRLHIRSRMLNFVGSMLFGSPKKLNLPSDFYYVAQDRAGVGRPGADNTERQMRRVYANQIRRAFNIRAAWVALGMNLIVLPVAAWYVLSNSDFTSTKNALEGAASAGSVILPKSMQPELSSAETANAHATVDAWVAKNVQDGLAPAQQCEKLAAVLNVTRRSPDAKAPAMKARIEYHMAQLGCGGY